MDREAVLRSELSTFHSWQLILQNQEQLMSSSEQVPGSGFKLKFLFSGKSITTP
jgi:hypothetical protein